MSPVEGSVRILYKMKMVSCDFDWQSQKMEHDPKHSQKVPYSRNHGGGSNRTHQPRIELCARNHAMDSAQSVQCGEQTRQRLVSGSQSCRNLPVHRVRLCKVVPQGDSSHAIRSWLFDEAIQQFWKEEESSKGTVVNFAEGLETQHYRLEDHMDEDALWISIDLIDGMRAREKFIQPDETHLHVAASVLDMDAWMPLVPKERPVFFTAQGLFMYLEEEANKKLFQQMADDHPGATLQFDWIAAWLSNRTMKGFKLTKDYTTPKMPFGVNKNNAKCLLESWVPGIEVEEIAWPTENVGGLLRRIIHIFMATPILKNYQPGFVLRVKFPSQ